MATTIEFGNAAPAGEWTGTSSVTAEHTPHGFIRISANDFSVVGTHQDMRRLLFVLIGMTDGSPAGDKEWAPSYTDFGSWLVHYLRAAGRDCRPSRTQMREIFEAYLDQRDPIQAARSAGVQVSATLGVQ